MGTSLPASKYTSEEKSSVILSLRIGIHRDVQLARKMADADADLL
jgi:hypothetical protein